MCVNTGPARGGLMSGWEDVGRSTSAPRHGGRQQIRVVLAQRWTQQVDAADLEITEV